MRVRTFGVALLAGGGLALGVTSVPPAVALSDTSAGCFGPAGTATLSAGSISTGESVDVSGCGFEPGRTVTIAVNDDVVATTQADPQGNFSYTLPSFTAPGIYLITAKGPGMASVPGGDDKGLAQALNLAAKDTPERTVVANLTVGAPSGQPAGGDFAVGGGAVAKGNESGPDVAGGGVIGVAGLGDDDPGAFVGGGVGVGVHDGDVGGGGGGFGGGVVGGNGGGGGVVGGGVVAGGVGGGGGGGFIGGVGGAGLIGGDGGGAGGGGGAGDDPGRQLASQSSGLPFTGAETGAMATIAGALVGGGVILRVAARRRRTNTEPSDGSYGS